MKYRLFGAAVAAMAMLASCETLVEQEVSVEVLPADRQVIFTADLGADTKTYLEFQDGVYKTRWDSDDEIFIFGTRSDGSYQYETVSIASGAGTSTATFAGTVEAENYFAIFGPGTVYRDGSYVASLKSVQISPKIYISETESEYVDNIYGAMYFPMYATSTTTSFSFKNLCSILKVGLTGNAYVEGVTFTPNDRTIPVAGNALVEMIDGNVKMSFVNDTTLTGSILYYLDETLSPNETKNCYISLPPGTYPGGFTLTIHTGAGDQVVNVTEDVTFERSQIRSIPQIVCQAPGQDPTEYVECASYDEVAALPDNTWVLVKGYVFVPYGRGFVMNIGSTRGNCILVYQGTDQSLYTPVMGNIVAMIAKKVTYNNLPELTEINAIQVLDNQVADYGYDRYYNLSDPQAFDNVQIERYEYVKFVGTLQKSGNYHNVIVDGATVRQGSIEYPLIDLTEYYDKKVSVEGWFIGFTGGGKYLKIVLRGIGLIDDSGSTEDVIPGQDIVVTKAVASTIK